jgi:hypothetical protein
MKVKHEFLRFGSIIVKDGPQVRFWEGKWLSNATLKDQYPCLYNIARPKFITISNVLGSSPPNLSWHTNLIGHKLVAWNNLLPRIANTQLTQKHDVFHWNLHPNNQFLVKSIIKP